MLITELSTSVSLIEDASREQIREMQETQRAEFVRMCEMSPEARIPSESDLNYWWPLTAKSDAP